jgi:hypothetical protein
VRAGLALPSGAVLPVGGYCSRAARAARGDENDGREKERANHGSGLSFCRDRGGAWCGRGGPYPGISTGRARSHPTVFFPRSARRQATHRENFPHRSGRDPAAGPSPTRIARGDRGFSER